MNIEERIRQIFADTYIDSELEPTDDDIDIAVKDLVALINEARVDAYQQAIKTLDSTGGWDEKTRNELLARIAQLTKSETEE